MRKFLVGVLLGVVLSAPSYVAVTIAEDDARWDCVTMGNKVCGCPDGWTLNAEGECH